MKFSSVVASQPLFIFILLAIGVLLLPSIAIPWWYKIIQHMIIKVDDRAHVFEVGVLSEIAKTAQLLHPFNLSVTKFATSLSSSLNLTDLSPSDLHLKVAPMLYQELSTIPHISQISYIGLGGPCFAYYREKNQTFGMYSNSTNSSNPNNPLEYTWYRQHADQDTGKLYGDATKCRFYIMVNASWVQEALNNPNGYASVANGWNSDQDLLFLNSIGVLGGKGVVSLGFSAKELVNFFKGIDLFGGSLFLATQNGVVLKDGLPNTKMVVNGNGDEIDIGQVSCMLNSSMAKPSLLSIAEIEYRIYCSSLEILGVQSVYAIAFPYRGLLSEIKRGTKNALIVLILMVGAVFISIASFVLLMVRAASKEISLSSALIRQKETTQQAERKSMNKSLAFASASHDIRASLVGITGLIQISYKQVHPASDLHKNLKLMNGCANDLQRLLDSILDTSKIEAGKMQVEYEEFDIANLVEDEVGLFHPAGMEKGVDVILDPCNGSLVRFCRVKGDRGKLKQVLSNLLNNAVKFTSEGCVTVRAWAKKPSVNDNKISCDKNGLGKYFWCWFTENKERNDEDEIKSVKENPNSLEFVFEVDDTGKGIPKEKQKSVFENFVQVKETASGQQGTGLGLGIVQSLVRLMGGEIGIVDKGNKRGTCFRFNVFLIASTETTMARNSRDDIEMGNNFIPENLGPTVRALTPKSSSPRLSFLSSSPRAEGSLVVLLIQNPERRRIVQKFMESLGIRVAATSKWEHLHSTLMKIKSKHNVSPYSSSGSKDILLSALDGAEQGQSYNRSRSIIVRGAASFILLVIDASAGPFEQLYAAVTEFKRGFHRSCKVVWLDKPDLCRINREMIDRDDDISREPFHGSHLYRVIRLLPEFGGNLKNGNSSAKGKEKCIIRSESMVNEGTSMRERHGNSTHSDGLDIEEEYTSQSNSNSNKPLSKLRFLVAEDDPVARVIVKTKLSRLGASVELCQNGQEAVKLVRLSLQEQRSNMPPYDYILMDCEMSLMDGYEATRQIRKEERSYDHIPIIALTAHTSGDAVKKARDAGMDFCLHKPIEIKTLLEAIRCTYKTK